MTVSLHVSPRRLLALAGAIGAVSAIVFAAFWWVWTTPPTAPDYSQDAAWVCRPGRTDACGAPTTTAVVAPDGTRRIVTTRPNPAAPVDCFYVYPTVSRARGAYSPIALTDEERDIARGQLARLSTVCRPFAPLYRQVTIGALSALFAGRPRVGLTTPYADVLAAWNAYLARDNGGRPVVLVGHSQGSRLLARLIAAEIDGRPIQRRLVAAILPGAEIDVPNGRDVGGTFKTIPLCRHDGSGACIIAYSSFPGDRPVPPDARFGRIRGPEAAARTFACVDPASVAGATRLDSVLPVKGDLKARFDTDFVELPGAISAHCRGMDGASVLAVEAGEDARTGQPTMALLDRLAQYQPAYGLHALDLNLPLGTFVDVIRQRASSYPRP